MKLAIILGTRPEIIKMSPIIRECEKQNLDFFILHTGQHYSYELDEVFFEELKLPYLKYNIEVGSGTHAEETGKALTGIERILITLTSNHFREHIQSECLIQIPHLLWNLSDHATPTHLKMVDLAV
ncbi:MAG: UDP-N-acetylglucosamine 2-epimerase, partial [Halobacteriota archaeon]